MFIPSHFFNKKHDKGINLKKHLHYSMIKDNQSLYCFQLFCGQSYSKNDSMHPNPCARFF